MTQAPERTVPYETYERVLIRAKQAERFLEWEDSLFAHADLLPGVKLTARALGRELSLEASDNLSHVPIWKIAQQTGICTKTVGSNITYLDKHAALKRAERYNPQTEKSEVAVRLYEPFLHPKQIIVPPRPKSGYHPPKPVCAGCGDELEIETAVLCPTCNRKHIVQIRPATANEHDLALTEKFNALVRMDAQLDRSDILSHRSPDEEEDEGEDTREASTGRPDILSHRSDEGVEADRSEESSDSPSTCILSEESSDAPIPIDDPPPIPSTPIEEPDQELEREAAQLLLDIAGEHASHIEMCESGDAKYITQHAALTLDDTLAHLRGRITKGMRARSSEEQDGMTRALWFDGDSPAEWERCKEAARALSLQGFEPLLLPSPTAGKHQGGGHLWLIFDGRVDAYSALQTVYQHTGDLLTGCKEYWPGGPTNVRLPGGKYVYECAAWCDLYTIDGEHLSRDGVGAAEALLLYQTPAALVIAHTRPEPEPQREPEPTSARPYVPQSGEGGYLDKDLMNAFIADFNDRRSWNDIVQPAGGFTRGKFLAVWRGDRTPNMAVNPRTDLAKDFARPDERAMDKYDVWCRIEAYQTGQDWQLFKKRDLAERCAYRREQLEKQQREAS